jgi:hypothetical protein
MFFIDVLHTLDNYEEKNQDCQYIFIQAYADKGKVEHYSNA